MTASRGTRSWLLAVCATALSIDSAAADVTFGSQRDLVSLLTRSAFREWTLTEKTTGKKSDVRQQAAWGLNSWTFTADAELVLYISAAVNEERGAQAAEFTGIGDLKGKIFYYVLDRKVLCSVGVNLPTGKTNLSPSEIRASQAIAPTVLGFPLKSLGEGFDVDVGLSGGYDLGRSWTVAGGVSFLHKGSYDLDPVTAFDPGGELAFTVGVDRRSRHWLGKADLVLRLFGRDRWNGVESFVQGDQLELTLNGQYRSRSWGFDAYFRDVVKADNEVLAPDTGPSPTTGNRVDNGNTIWFGLAPMVQLSPLVACRAVLDVIAANQSQQQEKSAWSLGLGPEVDLRLTPYAILELGYEYLTGATEDGAVDLGGMDARVALRWQY